MDARIQKMRERLSRQRSKIVEFEAQAAEMEKEIKRVEKEQLGYLARSAANTLTGGMEEVFELLRSLRAKSDATQKSDLIKEEKTVDELDETDETEV